MLRRTRFVIGLAALAATAAPLGCGSDDGLGKRVQVSGKVTYNGQPVKKGLINFVPESAEGRGASGEIADGQITKVTTQAPGDGVIPGKYKVAITAKEDVDVESVAKKYNAAPDPVTLTKAAAKAKALVPVKYSNALDSGLTADVSSSNTKFDFDLKD